MILSVILSPMNLSSAYNPSYRRASSETFNIEVHCYCFFFAKSFRKERVIKCRSCCKIHLEKESSAGVVCVGVLVGSSFPSPGDG
jgi:hypothetical protein